MLGVEGNQVEVEGSGPVLLGVLADDGDVSWFVFALEGD